MDTLDTSCFSKLTTRQQNALLHLESLCDSGTWEYDMLETHGISSQEIPSDTIIRHWRVPRVTGEFLYNTVTQRQSKRILELGTSTGYSTLWLGSAAAAFGGHINTIDYFGPKIPIAQRFITEAGLAEVITQHHMRIADFLAGEAKHSLSSPGSEALENFDLVFMDADKHNYLNYWKLLHPLLADDFLVIADNASSGARSIRPFVEHCLQDPKLLCEHVSIGTGLFIVRNR